LAKRSKYILFIDAAARIGGAAVGTYVALDANLVTIYLSLFAGMVIYVATSHILPEAHSHHPSRWTLAATGMGVLAMWLIVATLGH
jgi:ZIP family zinc transporter